jgi:MoaA/NifB/PqqE/SkfB family radical SAM enzyme
MSEILNNIVRPALKNCELLHSLGSGEFFVSKPLQEFYKTLTPQEFQKLKLQILTNGTLFTPERWGGLSNLKGMVDLVKISVDAARENTYEALRRGGVWKKLCENLKYISSLRKSGEINNMQLNFVVQKENLREMLDFVEFARELDVDTVAFIRLRNWGTCSEEEFIRCDVFSPQNLYYDEAMEMLNNLKQERGKPSVKFLYFSDD